MNLVLKTSLKNIFGKPFRTILVMFALFICSISALVCFDFIGSLTQILSSSGLGVTKAECILYADDYVVKKLPEGFPENKVLEIDTNSEKLFKPIEGEDFFVSYERLSIYGFNVQNAVDMEFIQPATIGLNETVITSKFAKDYGYKVGDKLTVHDRANEEVELTIVGISAVETKNFFIQKYSAFVNEETSKIISCGKENYGMVVIDVLDETKAKEAIKMLKDYYDDDSVMSFVTEDSSKDTQNQILKVFYLIFAIAFLLVIFVTASICNRIVGERMPFIGTLRSLGMSNARTARILLLENVLYALLGSVPAIVIYGFLRIVIFESLLGGLGSGDFKFSIPPLKIYAVAGVILGAIAIECLIPLKAILKALKTSIRDIIFDNRDTAYKFSKPGLIIGIVFVFGAIISALISKDLIATILSLLLSVVSLALLFPWILKGITALIKKMADKKEKAKWSLAAVEAISRKSTVGSGVLCVTAACMSIMIFTMVQGELATLVKDDYHCDVLVSCTKKTPYYNFIKGIEGVNDVEFVYESDKDIALNDVYNDMELPKKFYALPDGGFKYYKEFEGLLPERIEDGSIVIYDKYAEKNNLKVGDTIKLTFGPTAVVPIIREYKVAAVYNTKTIGTGNFFISEHDYKEVFKETPTYCLIKCDDPDSVCKMIKTYATGYYSKAQTHTEVINETKESNAKLNSVLIGIILVSIGMTFVGMVSNQLIGFEGRKKECAVMLSTAMNRGCLSGILLREMLITSVTASVIGAAVATFLVAVVSKVMASNSTFADIEFSINPVAIILFVVFLIVAFTGTALFPVRNLRKMKIAEQIKYE